VLVFLSYTAATLLKPVVLHIKLGLFAPRVHFITLFLAVKGSFYRPTDRSCYCTEIIFFHARFSFSLFRPFYNDGILLNRLWLY